MILLGLLFYMLLVLKYRPYKQHSPNVIEIFSMILNIFNLSSFYFVNNNKDFG
jgi:hypothetical protein